jgi:hypothetical protein
MGCLKFSELPIAYDMQHGLNHLSREGSAAAYKQDLQGLRELSISVPHALLVTEDVHSIMIEGGLPLQVCRGMPLAFTAHETCSSLGNEQV